ncbi:MAG: hypothetical protein LBH20_01230 [Treponema sp.]|jgi:hypothetical protein|nr:hypothetical protein [Treponema sp.]
MRCFCCAAVLLLCLVLSCARSGNKNSAAEAAPIVTPALSPSAVVQAGEYPLWFQFSADGPVLIETIEDACFSAALIPWPLAPHVRFMLAQGENLSMAVNGDGFICFSPRGDGRVGLYRFSGGEWWRQYTVGAFVLFDEKPAALLYRDDRFFDLAVSLPAPRLWTFDLRSGGPQALTMPSLNAFAPEDGWDIDTLRRGGDAYWYFRAVKKTAERPEIRMLRSGDLMQEGEKISLGAFQNAALPEPLSAAPPALREMLAAVFAESGCGLAAVVSPEFQTTRVFAADREKTAIFGFYSGRPENAFLLAAFPRGDARYVKTASSVIRHFSLPSLPKGFVYTGIGLCGDTIFASWEEQDEYSIGAAGFMVIGFSHENIRNPTEKTK